MPGYFGDVERFNKVTVKGIDPHNKKVTIKAEGFWRVFSNMKLITWKVICLLKKQLTRLITDHPEEKEIV